MSGPNMAQQPDSALVFIDFEGPSAPKNWRRTRLVRSHAVGVALARKRRLAQEKGENFRDSNPCTKTRTAKRACLEAVSPSGYLGTASVDPFETLPVNARRLTTLFHLRRSICAGEPVFNANDAIHFQTLHSVFQVGLTDGALTAAMGLTMCFATKDHIFDQECVSLSSVALQEMQKKLSNPVTAATPATIGTVLLLLGVEYRLGARQRAQAHLEGIRALMDECRRRNIVLPRPLRRAIYWQDLFSSMFVQTSRIVHYSDFHPGPGSPQLQLGPYSYVPEGFEHRKSRFGPAFMLIVSEVAALYYRRLEWLQNNSHVEGLETMCNTQADLEGRLHEIRQSTDDDQLISCVLALFLCVYAFWTSIWNAALVPRNLSAQLLHHLRRWKGNGNSNDRDLLFWLVQIGKAFAIDPHVRYGLEDINASCETWNIIFPSDDLQMQQILHKFIWSDMFYHPVTGWFWQRIEEGK